MARRNEVIRDSDREYAEYKECERQDFPYEQPACTEMPESCVLYKDDKGFMVCPRCGCSYGKASKVRKLVVTCIPCNKRAVLTFHGTGGACHHMMLAEFITYPPILCRDCLGVADVEVI